VVNFRCELETTPEGSFVSQPLFLQVQLWHQEASEELIKNNKLIPDKAEQLESSDSLKLVSEKSFKLNSPLKGIFDFLQP